jgi:NADPH2:quinone reductase
VHGASGGVGIAAVQIGLALGLRVIGTAGTQRGLAMLRDLGCSDVLDHHVRPQHPLARRASRVTRSLARMPTTTVSSGFALQSAGKVADVLALTDGKGASLIVEMLANVNLASDLRMLARGGTIAVVGSRGSVEVRGRLRGRLPRSH